MFASGQAVEVDVTRAFEHEQRPVYAEDGVHYTPLGNRLMADAIQPALDRCSAA